MTELYYILISCLNVKKCKSPQEQEKLKSKSSDSVLYKAGKRRTTQRECWIDEHRDKFVQLTGYNESDSLVSHTTGGGPLQVLWTKIPKGYGEEEHDQCWLGDKLQMRDSSP
jgi:hypothetical protein